jgi:hypothetical protein
MQWAINRINDIYFKNITFDGGGVEKTFIHLAAARSVLFDNVVFQNMYDDLLHHSGAVDGGSLIDNVWFRGCHFVGKERWAIYLDGVHNSGVVSSRIESGFGSGALLFLTNDDFDRDYNGDGQINIDEERNVQYIVVAHNSFAGSYENAFTGQDILLTQNTADGTFTNFAHFQVQCSLRPTGVVYYNYDLRVVNNVLHNVTYLAKVDANQVSCAGALSHIGRYTLTGNAMTSGTLVSEVGGTVDGPNTVSNNCVGTCTIQPTSTPIATSTRVPTVVATGTPHATPTATASPSPVPTPSGNWTPSNFPVGLFEDAGMQSSTSFTSMVNDIKGRGFDSVLLTNGSVGQEAGLLNVSDTVGGVKVYLAPMAQLNSQWWPSTVSADIATARSVIYPLVDQLKGHPSLGGYNIIDEPALTLQTKVVLAEQAFHERDASRASMPTLIGVYTAPTTFTAANPDALLVDVYPFGSVNGPCDTTMNGFGYPTYDFVKYVRQVASSKPANKPLWIILQTHNWGTAGQPYSLRVPTVPEVREENWLAVGEGATGIFWFIYSSQQGWTGLKDNPTLYTEVTNLEHRISPLKGVLLGLHKGTDQFSVSGGVNPYVSTLVSADGTKSYAVVVNRNCSPQTLSVASLTGATGQLKDLETNATYPLGSNLSLAAGDGRMFQFIPSGGGSGNTPTPVTPTGTPIPMTPTMTPVPPSATTTAISVTPTRTPVPPTATNTPVPTPPSNAAGSSGRQTGVISAAGGASSYTFVAGSDGPATIGSCAITTSNVYTLYVYDSSGTLLGSGTNSSYCNWVNITASASQTYTVKTVSVTGTGVVRSAWSINGAPVLWTIASGSISTTGGVQESDFLTLGSGTMTLSTCGPAGTTFNLYLYSATGVRLASATAASNCQSLSYTPSSRDLYRLREQAVSGPGAWTGTITSY